MATFAERLAERKANKQAGQDIPPLSPPPGVQQPTGQFGARLAQRKAEREAKEAGREQTIQETPSISGRISEAFTGAKRQTPETQSLPEFRDTEEIRGKFVTPPLGFSGGLRLPTRGADKQARLTAGLLSSFSPEARMDVIKESIPDAQFTEDAKGNIIVDIDGKRSVLNKPGLSGQDVVSLVANVLANMAPSKMAGLAKSTFARVIGTGLGEAAVEQGRQEVSRLAGSEQPREPGMTALAGAIGAGTELIGPARDALQSRRASKRVGTAAEDVAPALENIAAGEAASEATGIPLFKAQKSAVPSELERQAFLAQLPAGTQKAMRALSVQNKAASEAVENILTSLAPASATSRGAERFRSAAEKAVKAVDRVRAEAASPIYKQAFRRQRKGQLPLIDNSALINKIENMSKQFDPEGQISKNLETAVNKIKNAKGDLQRLHFAKTEIDQTINSFGSDSVGRTTKRFLTDVKNDLTDDLVGQSPSYRAARDEFSRLSPAVEAIKGSVIGKVSKLDEGQLKDIAGKIFNPEEPNRRVMIEAKKAIEDVDPDAWNDLLRVHLQGKLGTTLGDIDDLAFSVENAPSILHKAIFGNAPNRAVLYNSLSPEQAKNFKFLETALNRAKQGRPGGSQTGIRKEISREFDNGVVQAFRNFLINPIQKTAQGAVSVISGAGEEAARNSRIRAAAEVMFDPSYVEEMAKIRKLNPNTAAAGKAMAQLLKNIDINNEREQ